MQKNGVSFLFIAAALFALLAGLFFGMIGGLQYLLPDFLKEHLSFEKTRPLHVTLVITWIFTAATGGIYYYLPKIFGRKLYSELLVQMHFALFVATGIAIIYCYFNGNFGGREYLEFPPMLALPMLLTWVLFMINVFMTLLKSRTNTHGNFKKIYTWMWITGLIFFFITFLESYLWTFSFFGNNIIRDVTVQWKASGAMVGSWNMMVYGTGFYVMEKISGNEKITTAPLTFFFYFLGLTNLMFNWGHHTYIVPASAWIKNVAYIISMTELLILGSIIYNWKKTLTDAKKNFHILPYRFLAAADVWIFINLTLAILISVPAINYYTHGTHVTVAHAMGSTIGINTMILFASLFFISQQNAFVINEKKIKTGFWIVNISLLFFWISLIGSGIVKALEKTNGSSFYVIMQKLSPWFHAFASAGFGILIGIVIIAFPLLKNIFQFKLLTPKML